MTELDHASLGITGLSAEDVGELAARELAVLHELSTHTSTLEDIFLELTAEEAPDASAA